MKRIVVYLDEQIHRRLKAILALRGSTVSDWFRKMAQKILESEEK